ncbi:tetratricopeptide repeat protein [Ponticoccus sp. SC2-23]|uniref:tetratricopeptide repeat protein n=1 Tax=Alexandriicola marinus TaxID=2081710 RepID=UPI000FD78C87|nr:tetratricopeptide repeat protein [Alexandriicola marinus]MBM1220939.1 tetratricopeptide repeat protein [Ponticoccus sp. SC6-9]MBM1225509.1 tetratricopeptide repeat protein [Ponticoccus sp. SC6-15]MBM1227692.1 tetratricopeptide repeat protein [Ponticoccus sp. SC6-38]MBM1234670.1 tetratricopeptide repeat protein [Ponticoccus sp. SC6-45]MBM1238194.1 tetratricopeptide repeat protein [Ponticoccus sp. SC6-49]MBM1244173.1 tetratricopeptide repeat protein [Ponticoccus sp. SC2-64]MBM1248194.1 tetr
MTDYFDLGTHSRPASLIPEAQTWSDRGLVWLFAYNHEEAIACFEKALALDPDCAIAHWGIAYAIGPNYNKPWEVFDPEEKAPALARAHAALAAGLALSSAPAPERALLTALASRYPTDPEIEDYQPFNDGFAAAMKPVYEAHPDDLDVAFVYAEALMNRTPWQLWDFRVGIPNPDASTTEAMAVLERAFDETPGAWDHPGLLHMYIHLMEMSPHPERALRHGDRLTGLVPDAGHLVHMATHIDVLCGDYQNVLSRNLAAAQVDETFKAKVGDENFYALYRIHNLHFAMYGAMFLGQKAAAIDAALRLRDEVPHEVVLVYPDLFETFVAALPHVYIRFGMWSEILDLELPADTEVYTVTNALILYARAVALANLGRHDEAAEAVLAFDAAYAAVPEERMLFNNSALDLLAVARQMMLGEVAFKSGKRDEGLDHLRRAVALDDGLMYEEPWGWPQPTRHALGALLMEAGAYAEAEDVYRADLGLDAKLPRPSQHPRNVWALHGLHECLSRRGETVEIGHIRAQLDQALARADVPIRASCLCRAAA